MTTTELSRTLQADLDLLDQKLCLELPDFRICVRSNSAEVLIRLSDYFSHIVVPLQDACDAEVWAFEREVLEFPLDGLEGFSAWQREAGKQGGKDSFIDFPGARLLRKVRTGMVFLQSTQQCIAVGPCLLNDNQLINFIINQYMTYLQQQNWLICHAAALVSNSRALGLAGLSGGGKSSLMLRLLENDDCLFLSNDRLFVQPGSLLARGVPKQPRINPGTIVHSPRLQGLIDAPRRAELLAMPQQDLWDLEQKYDADVTAFYGPSRIAKQAHLGALLILNWQHGSAQETALKRVYLNQRLDLLTAVMKSPGPFYHDAQGRFLSNGSVSQMEEYQAVLADLPIFELTGRIDFERADSLVREHGLI